MLITGLCCIFRKYIFKILKDISNTVLITGLCCIFRKYILKGISNFIKKAKSLFNNSFDQVNDYSVKYEDYSPIDLGKNNVHYDQIKFALENEKIRNLAILGPYGSGKSSLIFSFFKNEKVHGKLVRNDEYVTISLPDFNYVSKNQCQDSLKRDDDTSAANGISKGIQQKDAELSLNKVENEIVRQLFQSSLAKCNRFANTLKNYPSKFECLIYTAIFLIVVSLFYLFFSDDKSVNLVKETLLKPNVFFISVLCNLPFIYYLVSFFYRKLRISKTTFGKLSIDFAETDQLGNIDHYLNDIVYLFHNSHCKYVIFEDLDRQKNKNIFTHLRNLNFVINGCNSTFFSINNSKRVVFIYLLDSSVFSDPVENVKFFDFTIPVNSILSCYYSENYLIKRKKELFKIYNDCPLACISDDDLRNRICILKEAFAQLNNELLWLVSSCLPDLRLIKKIYNDYQLAAVSYHLFSKVDGFYDQLFSMVVLRALYPNEYNNLLMDKGYLFELLNRKDREGLLENDSIYQVAQKNDIDTIYSKNDLSNDLIKLFLKKGYLAENYRFYLSVPEDGLLSKESLNYLVELFGNKSKYAPSDRLNFDGNFDVFINYLPTSYLIINFNLLNFEVFHNLLSKSDIKKYSDLFKMYCKAITEEKYHDEGFSFIIDLAIYIVRNNNPEQSMIVLQKYVDFLLGTYEEKEEYKETLRRNSPDYNDSQLNVENILENLKNKYIFPSNIDFFFSIDLVEKHANWLVFILVFIAFFSSRKLKFIQQSSPENLHRYFNGYFEGEDIIKFFKQYPYFLTRNLYGSMKFIRVMIEFNLSFSDVPIVGYNFSNRDIDFFYKFIENLIYPYPYSPVYSDKKREVDFFCKFGFELNNKNFTSIAYSLYVIWCKNNKKQVDSTVSISDRIISTIFTKFNKNLIHFFSYFFVHVFYYEKYGLFNKIIGIDNRSADVKKLDLKDTASSVLLLITIVNCYDRGICTPSILTRFPKINSCDDADNNLKIDRSSFIHNLLENEHIVSDNDKSEIFLNEESTVDAITNIALEVVLMTKLLLNLDRNSNNRIVQINISNFEELYDFLSPRNSSRIFPPQPMDVALTCTFNNILNYEFYNVDNQKSSNNSSNLSDPKLAPNIKNVIFIGRYLLTEENSIGENHKDKTVKEIIDDCWNKLARFFYTHKDEIIQSNSEAKVCKAMDGKVNNEQGSKIYLKALCKNNTYDFFTNK